jgi:hypothetical protein
VGLANSRIEATPRLTAKKGRGGDRGTRIPTMECLVGVANRRIEATPSLSANRGRGGDRSWDLETTFGLSARWRATTVELGITFGLSTNGGRPTMGRGHHRYVARWGRPTIMDVSVGIKDISSLRLLFSTFINFFKK